MLKGGIAYRSSGGLPQLTGSIIMYICEWTFTVHSFSVRINSTSVAQSLCVYTYLTVLQSLIHIHIAVNVIHTK